ncbi:MAG: 50S ribosomal protein L23 [Pseudomonadales bacterium]|jgi:large subunit ribosomal protein L23|nr:50S ribosomal protein L23 [Pseudomonadales bacterium]MDP6472612.1 50S ribosomal protein L23 [Pseudomonadales bacterium]MDP6829110.1 50S ribosomal protein L23 [Pseudomonadales bacterium]MDP6970778.1 50S ribosomal protein L23 [Pseudomonadales bacterium]|tara:strand:- start:202 stop:498 length:297 start_codon:yes stop_codon:yes gene_type:complete
MNQERIYTVLLEPHISEKVSILGDESNQYGFKVAKDATKAEIKEAVETLFGVDVTGVSTLNVKGKVKRSWRGVSRRKSWKKAYVRVTDGQELDFMVSD